MPLIELSRKEIERFLAGRRVVRVCFEAEGARYLIPLGYVWRDGALCGGMTEGRKTRMVDVDPRVTFQVDDTREAGLWEWTSVSGEGLIEWIEDPGEARALEEAQAARWSEMPDWLREEVEAEAERGRVRWYRLRPTRMSGVRSRPPPGPPTPQSGRDTSAGGGS